MNTIEHTKLSPNYSIAWMSDFTLITLSTCISVSKVVPPKKINIEQTANPTP